MAGLARDTAVHQISREDTASTFTATLSEEWAIWGPMGGYIGSIALRAAGAHCGRSRPASINVSFLAAAGFAEVDVRVETLRETRVATCVRAAIVQDGRQVLEATVWGTDATEGLEHHTARRPEVPHHSTLPSFAERLAAQGETEMHPFWQRLDYRPTTWTDDWENREVSEPEQWSWFRFVDGASFDDPWLDGTRLLMVTDLDAWGAATNVHSGELEWFAPTIELTCRFLQPATEHEWLLSWGSAPVGREGLIGVVSETWSADGQLLATGGSTLLCRPAPQRPDR
ncbi:MAG: acyl-CoA thioesterase-2 [Candidatus Aldehydirespiratoraceae bacterium]|jgi:acyl-CoA thioesterase-2